MNTQLGQYQVLPNSGFKILLSYLMILMIWVVIGAVCGGLTGCALMGSDFLMTGNERGIRAFGDHQMGLATSTMPEHHYKLRKLQETEATARHMKPSMLEGLFSKKAN